MPKPVPPPPPQPSAEETRAAVRLVCWLAVAALVLFGIWSSAYQNGYWAVNYGRDNGASWNIRKAETLEEDAFRSHPGGKVIWLVGSSILRESFSQKRINGMLTAQQSEWRVVKFGQTRGAAGLSAGMLRHLPLRPGDRVIHGVAVENLRKDWVNFTDMPDWRVMLMLNTEEIWDIDEWSVAKKLEATAAFPRNFYRYHEEAMTGWIRWLNAPLRGRAPKVREKSWHIGARQVEQMRIPDHFEALGLDSRYGIRTADYDDSTTQFNIQGLQRMRTICEANGVALTLVQIPQRQQYRERFIGPGVMKLWRQWMKNHDVIRFPHPPDDDYYDMKHPNKRGRRMLSDYLVTWLNNPTNRPPTGWNKAYLSLRNQDTSGDLIRDRIVSGTPLEAHP